MSDQDLGKKMCEEYELEYFIDAYKYVTGEELTIVSRSEKPDFLCERNGQQIGVELSKIVRGPQSAFWDKAINKEEFMKNSCVLDFIYRHIVSKTKKMIKGNWTETILVLQLMDCPLSEIKTPLDRNMENDFAENRFSEIWLADYTSLDAYGDIELFGLYPPKYWGYHQRNNPLRKPYG